MFPQVWAMVDQIKLTGIVLLKNFVSLESGSGALWRLRISGSRYL